MHLQRNSNLLDYKNVILFLFSVPSEPAKPSITLQIRYEHSIETLFITIFELANYLPSKLKDIYYRI